MKKVVIGIQARSSSSRLSGKALKILHNKPILSWVLNACQDSATFLNKNGTVKAEVVILCPEGDELIDHYSNIPIIEGDMNDVLSRYIELNRIYKPDYVCRITADCPLLTGFMITNHVHKAIKFNLDYLSNVDEQVRTELDGRDIEILSSRSMNWLEHYARTKPEREHVTLKIRTDKPKCLRRAHSLSRLDLSDVKLSIDTEHDFERVQSRIVSFLDKRNRAVEDVGESNVFYV